MKPIEINALLGIECDQPDESDETLVLSNGVGEDLDDHESVSICFSELPFADEYDFIAFSRSHSSSTLAAVPSYGGAEGHLESAGAVSADSIADTLWFWDSLSHDVFSDAAPIEEFASVDTYDSVSDSGDEDTGFTSMIPFTSPSSSAPSFSSVSDIEGDNVHAHLSSTNSTTIMTTAPRTLNSTITPNLSDFTLMEQLGKGAFGTVFLAHHRPSGVRVALKAISKELPSKVNGKSLGDVTRARAAPLIEEAVTKEFFALIRTQGEKSILQIQAAFHDPSYFYLATVSLPLLRAHSVADILLHIDLSSLRRFKRSIGSIRLIQRRSCTVLYC